jgi:hypothetical protein
VTREEDTLHPCARPIIKTPGPEDGNQAAPIDRVKGFPKIDFKNNGGGLPGMAAA